MKFSLKIFVAVAIIICAAWFFYPKNYIQLMVGEDVYCVPKEGYLPSVWFLPINYSETDGITAFGCSESSDKNCLLSDNILQFEISSQLKPSPIRNKRQIEKSVEYIEVVKDSDGKAVLDLASGFYITKGKKNPQSIIWVWEVASIVRPASITLPDDAVLAAICTDIVQTSYLRQNANDANTVCTGFGKTNNHYMRYDFSVVGQIPSRSEIRTAESSIDLQLDEWKCR